MPRGSGAGKSRRRDERRESSASQCLRWWGRCWYWTSKAPSVLADHGRLTAKPRRRTPGLLHFSGSVGGGYFGGGFALTPPALGGLEADQRARADAHHRWSPSGPPHLEKHIFRNAVLCAEFFDAHRQRRSANCRHLVVGARGHRRPLAGNFGTCHRCHPPESGSRTIRRLGFLTMVIGGNSGELLRREKWRNYSLIKNLINSRISLSSGA